MTFKCNDCFRTLQHVQDIRNCERCQESGRSGSIQEHHEDNDSLTPAILGFMLGSTFSLHESPSEPSSDPVVGGGGEFSGGGASGSFDSPSVDSSPSSNSGSSSDSGSSGGGSSD